VVQFPLESDPEDTGFSILLGRFSSRHLPEFVCRFSRRCSNSHFVLEVLAAFPFLFVRISGYFGLLVLDLLFLGFSSGVPSAREEEAGLFSSRMSFPGVLRPSFFCHDVICDPSAGLSRHPIPAQLSFSS